MYKIVLVVLVVVLFVSWTQPALARLGVGVGTGSISVDENLRPGGIYNLPPISVFNTGDERADYALSIAWHEDQPEKRPLEEWFEFEPAEFSLEPNGAQAVVPTIHLPVRVEPGQYFAYIEAGPLQTAESGESRIGVAAAVKLSFTVEASNIWWAIYYRIAALWSQYAPWTYAVIGVLSAGVVLFLLRKRFMIRPRRIKLT
ncbi:MAG TPA: hypothetical protein VF996_00395 [Candidatus Saccharimonadales bacterium]